MTLTLCEAEHFQSKLIPLVPKDVILIYSLSPLNGAALAWQPFSRPEFKEHTILFFQGPFKTWAEVCRGALMDVSHLAWAISFMAGSERDE